METLSQFEDLKESVCRLTLVPFVALWILLFKTSAGAHAVVATVPATSDAKACVRISSFSEVCERIARFAAAYGAICPTSTICQHPDPYLSIARHLLMRTLLTILADIPLPNTLRPSSRPIL